MALIAAFEDIEETTLANLNEEEVQDLELGMVQAEKELEDSNDEIEEKASVLFVAMEAYDDFRAKRISFDHFRHCVFAAETAVNGNNRAMELVFANEAVVVDRLLSSINSVISAIRISFSKYVDYLQFSVSLFTLQRNRILGLRRKLQATSGTSATVTIGVNKYMRFGENQNVVRDMKEYTERYQEMLKAMTPFNSAMAELTEDDLFSGIRLFKEGVIGDPEKWFKERFLSVEESLKKASSGVQLHASSRNKKYTEYTSPVLLGCSSALIRMPNKDTYSSGSYEDYYGAHRYFYACIDRKVKVRFSTLLDGSMQLDVKKADLSKNLDDSLHLIEASLRLTSLASRFSNMGGFFQGNVTHIGKRKREEGFQIDVFETMMFYRRICSMIYDSVSSAYNFSIGNVKQLNRIAEKAIDRF